MSEQLQKETQAIKILALAAEKYLATQDDLGKAFIAPQLDDAIKLLSGIIIERHAPKGNPEPETPADPEV